MKDSFKDTMISFVMQPGIFGVEINAQLLGQGLIGVEPMVLIGDRKRAVIKSLLQLLHARILDIEAWGG